MIRTVLLMIVLFALFFLLVLNRDSVIAMQVYPRGPATVIPFYLFLLGTFLSGYLLSFLMIFPGWLKLKLESRRQKKEIESLVEEIGYLRTVSPTTPVVHRPSTLPIDSPGPL